MVQNRLTAAVSVFRVKLDHVAQASGRIIPGTTESTDEGKNGTVSRGMGSEVNGAVTDN
ncbi:hypothetical protein SJI19_06880 [Acerihabitans sp. TG2]|uniref:hypothetical protein n=1 Tax=Acerihabitans sp. TG2 TaxID=3096008 RepID=UPI002B2240CB|nr:hypothetical protein [Acerihabitans sp. TG2]MEA9390274.1 hypothetical protein [Acerihabitans sp. TG2]